MSKDTSATEPVKTLAESFDDVIGSSTPKGLVQHFLSRNSIARVFGASGLHKSFLIISMALHVSAGLPWFGHQTIKTHVTYLYLEGREGAKQRLDAFKKEHPDFPTDNISFVRRSFQMDELLAEIYSRNSGLVVIDTLEAISRGLDENSSEMDKVLDIADEIVERTGACVLFIGHPSKANPNVARGTGRIRDAIDTELKVFEDKEKGCSVMVSDNQRDIDKALGRVEYTVKQITLDYTDDFGEKVTSLVVTAPTEKNEPTLTREQKLMIVMYETYDVPGGGLASEVKTSFISRWKMSEDTFKQARAKCIQRGWLLKPSKPYLEISPIAQLNSNNFFKMPMTKVPELDYLLPYIKKP